MHKYHSSKAFQVFSVIIIAGLCVLLDTLTQIHFKKVELPKNHPQYNATGVDIRAYNKRGHLLYSLLSDSGWEYPDDNKIFLKKIKLDMYPESSNIMQYSVRSDDGWIDRNSKVGQLGANVVGTLYNIKESHTVLLFAKDVNLNMNNQTFKSNQDAHATQGKSIIYTHGFSYDNTKKFLTLNSKVRIIYVQ